VTLDDSYFSAARIRLRALEAAAVTHHHRQSGGVQMTVVGVDTSAQTIELGNINGTVTYQWRIRKDSGGFRFKKG
jgi:hypothetical protein